MDHKEFFAEHGVEFLRVYRFGEHCSVKVEDLYLAIKARLMDEIVAERKFWVGRDDSPWEEKTDQPPLRNKE